MEDTIEENMALFPLGTQMGEQPEPAMPSARVWEDV